MKTVNWFKTNGASPLLSMVAIGTSVEGEQFMIVGTTASNFDPQTLKGSENQHYLSKLEFILVKLMVKMQV
jgi:hypothetical protein